MKKLIVTLLLTTIGYSVFAWGPPPPPPPCPGWGGGWWGRGGCNFWPGFIGGFAGAAIGNALTAPRYAAPAQSVVVTQPVVVQQPAPVVVSQPVVVQRQPVTQTTQVWVEGRYIDQVQANGTVIRTWQPGHYETRTVTTY